MNRAETIRQTLHTVKRYPESTIIAKVDDGALNPAIVPGFAQDLSTLAEIGFRIAVFLPKSALAHFNHTRSFRVVRGEFTPQYLGKGQIAVIGHGDQNPDRRAAALAVRLWAKKLLYLTKYDGIFSSEGKLLSNLTLAEASLIEGQLSGEKKVVRGSMADKLHYAILACRKGVERIHIVNGQRDGIVLEEIFSSEGAGTMIYNAPSDPYIAVRQATANDVPGIFTLLSEARIGFDPDQIGGDNTQQFLVYEVDREIQGCVRLRLGADKSISLDYLSASPQVDFRESAAALLKGAVAQAGQTGVARIVLTRNNDPWLFVDPVLGSVGFQPVKGGNDRPWYLDLIPASVA